MNTSPLFFAARSRIAELLPRLHLVQKADWSADYLDQATGERWIRYPLWDYHGPGPDCLRRGDPDLGEILECIGSSHDDAEVAAAAFHLVNEHPARKENYAPLVDYLEGLVQGRPSVRQLRNAALAIIWSAANQPFNSRDPSGKSIEQVDADYRHFVEIAARARAVKARAEEELGCSITQQSVSFA
ncbi:hypothetical protein [Paucibacter sp. B51]|uniref:hypothetical protein n=1 Tax=Paucibacter sp. B51 TaxID=2993315 RepID=UPI0022EBAFF1|nr:hypothetical protein [Paucibacter sp. B51]